MRITNQLAFQNAQNNYQKTMKNLFRTNQQLGSGLKIQNSFENTGIYVDAMRLDYEASTLVQVKETSSKAQAFANNTDKAFNQFSESFDQFKYKLIQAANEGAMSSTSREAIANDLEGIKNHLMNVSNTSINGTFLFSGSATNIKPISADGTYNGNGESIKALVGSGVELAYNIDGESLFLGTSGDYQKLITTNMPMLNQAKLNPTVMSPNEGDISREEYLRSSDKIRDMVGDSDSDKANDPSTVFYLSGSDSYGNGINQKIEMTSDAPISDLLKRIGNAYGNTSTNEVVNVSLNDRGQIEIKDLRKGSNQLEFHMFGAIDRVAAPNSAGNADVTDLDALFSNPNVDIVEFTKSNFKSNPTASTVASRERLTEVGVFSVGFPLTKESGEKANSSALLRDVMGSSVDRIDLSGMNSGSVPVGASSFAITTATTVQDLLNEVETRFGVSARVENGQILMTDNALGASASYGDSSVSVRLDAYSSGSPVAGFTLPDGANYDRRGLEQVGSHLKGNASQIVNKTGAYATSKDTLVSAAGVDDLNGKIFRMEIVDISGNPRTVEINLADPQSAFSVDAGTPYVIFDSKGEDTSSKNITYQQLMDVMSMAISGSFAQDSDSSGTIDANEYNSAIKLSKNRVDVNLDSKGRFELIDRTNSVTPMRLNIYDIDASNFGSPSALRFMENNALTIDEPSLNVFEDLDRMIEAVRTGTYHANGEGADPRNIGIQNSIERLDHIMDHFTRSHTKIGALSNALKDTQERSELLIVNVNSVKSEIIDADYGETMIQFQQLALSYEAMLSSVAKINSLSLLNYL
ncbi:MAG: flagellar hook-associated protein FlgL [Campylobacteraceae bacterium]|nr:flagellar hook-associated protein FlgL [Campylobacteraceae bacterium]